MMRYPGLLSFYMCAGQFTTQSQAQQGGRDHQQQHLTSYFNRAVANKGPHLLVVDRDGLGQRTVAWFLSLEITATQTPAPHHNTRLSQNGFLDYIVD